MRKICLVSVAAVALMSGTALGQSPTRLRPIPAGYSSTETEVDGSVQYEGDAGDCDSCGGGRRSCGRHGHRCGAKGADGWFNCNCGGSYKFPVPPLYTYHWPGLFSLRRMTDYQSPWRYPAIKPYEDETPVRDLSQRPEFRQASLTVPIRGTGEESISAKIARRYEQ